MNRLLIAVATATAACAAAVPAVLGLSGNPSFSQHIPVPVPSRAQVVQFDDRGRIADDRFSASPSPSGSTSHTETGDDHGGLRTSREPEPGDDGGDRGRGDGVDDGQTSPSGADHRGHHGGDDDGDDHGGHSGHGGGDD